MFISRNRENITFNVTVTGDQSPATHISRVEKRI